MLGSLAEEFKGCVFGDKRLARRVVNLAESVSEHPEFSINAACGSFAASKAAYRFLQNQKVSPSQIMKGHLQNTENRIAACQPRVLIIQDTTDLIYTQFPSIQNLGIKLRSKEGFKNDVCGLMLHTSFAVSAEGIPLGVLKQTMFTFDEIKEKRGQEETCVRGINKNLPIEQKASYRWIDHLTEANERVGSSGSDIVHVADRECDIYEFLQAASDQKSNFVVRSSSNRRTHEGSVRSSSTIDKKLAEAPNLGAIVLKLDGNEITCRIRAITTQLRPPQRSEQAKSMDLRPLSVGVVEVKQENCETEPVHWRLLTNLPVGTFEEALDVASIYKQRWSIECFHRILKSGFGIEEARLGYRQRLENLTSLLSIVSWHIFWLYQFGRKMPAMEASKVFDPITIKVLKASARKLKVTIGSALSIGQAVLIIARLGGFLGRRGDGAPGMISIWRGWRCLHERIEFMEALTCG
jgi:hypothetical protein